MPKRVFPALILILLIAACATPATPEFVPATTESTAASKSEKWWRAAVFYEIFVRSYYDSDGNGIGDFNGMTQKLDYIQALGVKGIWLMPIFPSPSYHGYDATDYYAVNPQYGSMDEFKNFLNEAHKRNIRVIIDLPLNHTSDSHPWFKESREPDSKYRDWYIWKDKDPKYKGPWGEDVWHPSQSGYYYGIFTANMPDLNYRNAEVTAEMLKVARYWLQDIGVDGYRLDAIKHLIEQGSIQQNTIDTHVWLKKNFYPAVKAAKPEAFTIGELFGDDLDTILGYTKGRQFDSAFHFQLAEAILKSVNTSNGMYVSSMLKISEKKLPDDQYAPFLANHDQNRAMSQLYGDMNKARLAAFLMLTSPGTPFIYYGEEIGMKGQKPDEDIRLPMQWNPQKNAGFTTNKPWRAPAKDYEFINVELQTGIPGSLLEHYRAVIQLRNAHPALSIGALTVLETNHSSIYAVLRADMDETLLVLVNLKDEPVTRYGIVMDKSPFKGIIEGVETLFGVGDAKVPQKSGDYKPFESLAPYAMYILKIKY